MRINLLRVFSPALLLIGSIAPVQAQPVSATAEYVISVGGTIVANAQIKLHDAGSSYTVELNANVTGLGRFVASGSATARVSGTSTRSAYRGKEFNLQTRTSEGSVTLDVRLSGGNVTAFYTDPPPQPHFDQVPLERRHLVGVNDMLSAFILKGARLDRSLCERTLSVFTGVERFDLQLRFASAETATSARTGYRGPVVLCQVGYQPISGHYLNSEITTYLQASDRILIWYAPLENSGTFIPYRVLIGTSLGDLSMVLTSLS
ncbi:MAG TPA: DUF3108 domain-containing protein [Devosia sp.]|nr:DUF3108 domain-containing protein [Devosia sp.]